MAATQKTLPELYKIEPLDGINYKRWSQKLLLCFEPLEIDYVLTTYLLNEITTDAKPSTHTVPKTPSIPLDDATKKKLEKGNKLARSYLLNNMCNPLFDLFVIFKFVKAYGPNWKRNMVQTMPKRKSTSSASGCSSRLWMTNRL